MTAYTTYWQGPLQSGDVQDNTVAPSIGTQGSPITVAGNGNYNQIGYIPIIALMPVPFSGTGGASYSRQFVIPTNFIVQAINFDLVGALVGAPATVSVACGSSAGGVDYFVATTYTQNGRLGFGGGPAPTWLGPASVAVFSTLAASSFLIS